MLFDALTNSIKPFYADITVGLFAVAGMIISLLMMYFGIKMIIRNITGYEYTFIHGRFLNSEQLINYIGSDKYNDIERERFYSTPYRKRRGKRFKAINPMKDQIFLDEYKRVYGRDYEKNVNLEFFSKRTTDYNEKLAMPSKKSSWDNVDLSKEFASDYQSKKSHLRN